VGTLDISEHGRRYTAPSQEAQERLVELFLAATQRGEVQALAAVLAEDVSWWADGGGKVYAAPYPLHGRERVLSLLRGLLRKVPSWYPDLHFSSARVNGTPGILVWSKETLVAIIACEMTEEHITNLYEVINPDKLAYIQIQIQPHR
jgi:RNA polymerase sigma-70 factor (ECF subfamily)